MAPRGIIMGNIFMCSWGNGVSQKAIISVAITHCRICSAGTCPNFLGSVFQTAESNGIEEQDGLEINQVEMLEPKIEQMFATCTQLGKVPK